MTDDAYREYQRQYTRDRRARLKDEGIKLPCYYKRRARVDARTAGQIRMIKDIAGQTFGNLTVLRLHPEPCPTGGAAWVCRCVCGSEVVLRGAYLRRGDYKDCGCLTKPRRHKRVLMIRLSDGG
jgi:hypothetical protein